MTVSERVLQVNSSSVLSVRRLVELETRADKGCLLDHP